MGSGSCVFLDMLVGSGIADAGSVGHKTGEVERRAWEAHSRCQCWQWQFAVGMETLFTGAGSGMTYSGAGSVSYRSVATGSSTSEQGLGLGLGVAMNLRFSGRWQRQDSTCKGVCSTGAQRHDSVGGIVA